MKNSKRRKVQEKRQNLDNSGPPRDQRDGFWLYGTHAVAAALANPERDKHRLAVTSVDHGLSTDGLEIEIMERHDLEKRLPLGAVHQGMALFVSPLPRTDLNQVLALYFVNNIQTIQTNLGPNPILSCYESLHRHIPNPGHCACSIDLDSYVPTVRAYP